MAWFRHIRRHAAASARMVVLHHAGGTADLCRPTGDPAAHWTAGVPDDVEIWPVELPGRGMRFAEPPADTMAGLAADLSREVLPLADLPLVVMGHSMGTVLAFELARRLEAAGRGPVLAIMSGRQAPHLPAPEGRHLLPRDGLVAEMRRLGGTPPEVFEHAELLDWVLPVLRADYRLLETHRVAPTPPLACPILAIAGLADADATPARLAAWSEVTTGPVDVVRIPGGHFQILDQGPAMQAPLRQAFAAMAGNARLTSRLTSCRGSAAR
ncbi:alpha/beta fold hydrolase (plasmid) [Tistrella mobilis]|uniref:thioesterase II family protein n=1 Tax=Tistrella mobilis TaxID=171437 RepID=UPI0035583EA3